MDSSIPSVLRLSDLIEHRIWSTKPLIKGLFCFSVSPSFMHWQVCSCYLTYDRSWSLCCISISFAYSAIAFDYLSCFLYSYPVHVLPELLFDFSLRMPFVFLLLVVRLLLWIVVSCFLPDFLVLTHFLVYRFSVCSMILRCCPCLIFFSSAFCFI